MIYYIRMSEDEWLSYPDEHKRELKQKYITLASRMGHEKIVLKLEPDPIFPSTEHNKPYIEWQYNIPQPDTDWTFSHTVYISTNIAQVTLSKLDFIRLEKMYKQYPKGTRFIVRDLQGIELLDRRN